jgi:hypothetical protein
MCSSNIFGARTNHGHTRTHKTHRGPDLGEATTFLFKVFSVISHGATSKCHFVLGFPTFEIPEIGTPTTLEAHNFLCRLSIGVRSKAKL